MRAKLTHIQTGAYVGDVELRDTTISELVHAFRRDEIRIDEIPVATARPEAPQQEQKRPRGRRRKSASKEG